MPKITQIKQAKFSPDHCVLFLNAEFWISLHKNYILSYGLYRDLDISTDIKKELEQLSDVDKKMGLIRNYEKTRRHSRFEIYQYLVYRKSIEAEEANALLQKAENEGLLNDLEFAMWFAEMRLQSGKYGKNRVKNELILKGVDNSIIKEVLNNSQSPETSEVSSHDNLKKLISKLKSQVKESDELKKRQKIIIRALGRGFEYDEVKRVYGEVE